MFHLEGYWLRSVILFYFMYSMNNVLNSIMEESMRKGAKTLIDEVLKLDPNEITNNTAEVLNELLKGILVMNVNEDGSAEINIKLSADQIKYILQEISKQL